MPAEPVRRGIRSVRRFFAQTCHVPGAVGPCVGERAASGRLGASGRGSWQREGAWPGAGRPRWERRVAGRGFRRDGGCPERHAPASGGGGGGERAAVCGVARPAGGSRRCGAGGRVGVVTAPGPDRAPVPDGRRPGAVAGLRPISRGGEAAAAPYTGGEVGDQLRCRPRVLRARGPPAGTSEAHRTDRRRRRPGGARVPARGMGREPAQPGGGADAGAGGTAVRDRDAVVLVGAVTAAAALGSLRQIDLAFRQYCQCQFVTTRQ
ncbi:hypothetical protein ACVW0K_007359 [Streptomyces filamentosus]